MAEQKNSLPAHNFELFFELSPDLLCIAGYDGFFKKINPAVSKFLGYTDEELYSKPINDFVYKEDQDRTSEARNGLAKNIPLYNFENRYLTKRGDVVWLSWTSFPVDSDNMIFAIAKNVTHKKRLELERNTLLKDLKKTNKDLTQFSYKTSHDLRSPVNNLLSIFNILDLSKINDTETREYITILKLATDNLYQTLNKNVEVLLKKAEYSGPVEKLNFNESLDLVLRSINSLIETSKATIKIDFSELEEIKFNKAFLESIFINLITNSIKYSRPGIPCIIKIYSQKVNGFSQLIVSDNGLGFDMETVKDRIFGFGQKFHNHSDSNGIGLYLVYNHITSLGGSIVVDSKINEGATFTITFLD